MSIEENPPIDPKHLEEILKLLPEPKIVTVALFGEFDYSGLSDQTDKLVPGVRIRCPACEPNYCPTFALENPTKNNILDIYRLGLPRLINGRNIQFKTAFFSVGYGELELTPTQIMVKYTRHEPEIVSKLRQLVGRIKPAIILSVDGRIYGYGA